jgi:putative CocE/NonD family hydrolase
VSIPIEVLKSSPLHPHAKQIAVRMRDGVNLATDVYLPEDPGPNAAVLVRLPYDKNGRYTFMPAIAPFFTERGYVFVVQDVRGKFRSEGETVAFEHEIDDGYDTIQWITEQPWCDGDIGMWGDSYYGYTQWAAVASGHPALKAIVPRVTSADLGLLWSAAGDLEPPAALYGAQYLAHYWLDQWIYGWEVDYTRRPLKQVFDPGFEAVGARSESFDRMIRAAADGEVLSPYHGEHPFDLLRIPVLHTGGWFDNIMPDQMRDWDALAARPKVAHLQYLEMNSTDHENYHLDLVPIGPEDDHNSNEEALARMLPRYLGSALDFFDVFLKGKGEDFPRARWHRGNDGWQSADSWPPPGVREMQLHLTAADRGQGGAGGGGLAAAPDTDATEAWWTHDPANLVPSTVENPFAFLFTCPDERIVAQRADVLTFTSEPMTARLDLAGPVSITLGVSSTARSTALFVKLVDVRPDGTALMLTRGQGVIRDPDPARAVTIPLAHAGYRLPEGHRLGLQIASSDFPLFLWHPGTDEDPWQATEGKASEQTLPVGGGSQAFLSLTVEA